MGGAGRARQLRRHRHRFHRPGRPGGRAIFETFYKNCFRALGPKGVVVGQSESPLFHANLIVSVQRAFRAAGFRDVASLFFPQCTYPSGWWSATLACRATAPPRSSAVPTPRKKSFPTRYYNAAIHTAALATPEFLVRQLRAKHFAPSLKL